MTSSTRLSKSAIQATVELSEDELELISGGNAFEITEFSLKAENSTNIGSRSHGAGEVKLDRLSSS